MSRTASRPSARYGGALVLAFVVLLMSFAAPASAAMTAAGFEDCLLEEVNASRAAEGAGPLAMATDLIELVREHSVRMSETGFRHMTDAERAPILPDGTTTWAENIAWTSVDDLADCTNIHELFMNSPGHRANILNSSMTFFAPGVFIDSTGTWVTELFFASSDYTPAGEGIFWDDDASIFEADIEKLYTAGITKGCADGKFCPDAGVTRGQMAAFLVRALGLPEAPSAGFTDTSGTVFAADIDSLAAAGITTGCSATKFCPESLVTRAQMAAFLSRGLALPAAAPAGFTDTVGNLFEFDIDRLAGAGITTGCGGTKYCPDQAVTRGQMAAFLVRALGL